MTTSSKECYLMWEFRTEILTPAIFSGLLNLVLTKIKFHSGRTNQSACFSERTSITLTQSNASEYFEFRN